MSKKSKRLRSARSRLLDLASQGELMCTRHNREIKPYEVYSKRCYTQRRKVRDCKYLMYKDGK